MILLLRARGGTVCPCLSARTHRCHSYRYQIVKERNDRPFIGAVVKNFLTQGDLEALWKGYPGRFESRQEFETAVDEFRRAVADIDLRGTIHPTLVAGAGGYDKLIAAVQEIHKSDQAKADLDALVLAVEAINRQGGSSKDVFAQVFQEVQS